MALKLGIQTYQILTKDDKVCIPSLSSILLAVSNMWDTNNCKQYEKYETLHSCSTIFMFYVDIQRHLDSQKT